MHRIYGPVFAGKSVFPSFMQRQEIQQGRQHLLPESNPDLAEPVTATKYQPVQVFSAFFATPENLDGFTDAFMMLADNRQLMVNARLPGPFLERHRPGGLIFRFVHETGETGGRLFLCHNLSCV